MASKGKKKLESKLGPFVKQYARPTKNTPDPNDRQYDRRVEKKIRRMNPIDFDKMLNGDNEDE